MNSFQKWWKFGVIFIHQNRKIYYYVWKTKRNNSTHTETLLSVLYLFTFFRCFCTHFNFVEPIPSIKRKVSWKSLTGNKYANLLCKCEQENNFYQVAFRNLNHDSPNISKVNKLCNNFFHNLHTQTMRAFNMKCHLISDEQFSKFWTFSNSDKHFRLEKVSEKWKGIKSKYIQLGSCSCFHAFILLYDNAYIELNIFIM